MYITCVCLHFFIFFYFYFETRGVYFEMEELVGMRLAREPGAGSGEQGKRERGVGIVVRNPEIDKFHQKWNFILMFLLKNCNFSQNLDLLPWVQKNLLPS
jgi:hypothetical protein